MVPFWNDDTQRTNLISNPLPGQAPRIFLSALLTPDWCRDSCKIIIDASQMVFWSSRDTASQAAVILDIAYHCLYIRIYPSVGSSDATPEVAFHADRGRWEVELEGAMPMVDLFKIASR